MRTTLLAIVLAVAGCGPTDDPQPQCASGLGPGMRAVCRTDAGQSTIHLFDCALRSACDRLEADLGGSWDCTCEMLPRDGGLSAP